MPSFPLLPTFGRRKQNILTAGGYGEQSSHPLIVILKVVPTFQKGILLIHVQSLYFTSGSRLSGNQKHYKNVMCSDVGLYINGWIMVVLFMGHSMFFLCYSLVPLQKTVFRKQKFSKWHASQRQGLMTCKKLEKLPSKNPKQFLPRKMDNPDYLWGLSSY